MLRISDIKLPVDHTEEDLKTHISKIIRTDEIKEIKIFRRSIDSRKKSDIHFVYTVDVVSGADEAKILKKSDPKKVSEAKQ